MRKLLFITSLCTISIFTDAQVDSRATPYWQQNVNYIISVSLNDKENTLDGFETMEYTNHSPDTLKYLWMHLWPNAFKTDRTAFSDQALENGKTNFYFSDHNSKGYINRLDFKVNGITARFEDHPVYKDIARLILPIPLVPGGTIKITTPFHEKIPLNFSRGGHIGQSYQITQWYPKPAVYDRKGWHPMPYLDQGEFYSEFGDYEVNISIPTNYVVAASGELQGTEERDWLFRRANELKKASVEAISKNKSIVPVIPSSPEIKTVTFKQSNVHDFAWFADKSYIMDHDTLQLASGKIIKIFTFYPPSSVSWNNSVQYIKDAVRTRSEWLGEYPYNVVKAWETPMGFSGGMEYPTITSISPGLSAKSLDLTLEHEVGHNWNYGILANNERDHPWMDEGMNTYFDIKYIQLKYGNESLYPVKNKLPFLLKRIPSDPLDLMYRSLLFTKTDQPIETSSEKFSDVNYELVAYYKAGKWMKLLELNLGEVVFNKAMHEYFNQWKFKHPYPEDFKKVVQGVSGKNVDSIFKLLVQKGSLEKPQPKNLKLMGFGSFRETDRYNHIFLAPAFGYNYYDKLMLGVLVHNYTLPITNFNFFLAPLYATGSKMFSGIGRVQYNRRSYGMIQKIQISLSGEKFSDDQFTDSTGNKTYLGFLKMVPSVKMVFRKSPRSSVTSYVQWKTFFIREQSLAFIRDTVRQLNIITYPKINRYINQLKFVIENARVLYPFWVELQGEQSTDFIKTTLNLNYYFNYLKGGGMSLRFFAGKFFYIGDRTYVRQFETDRYHFNMSGPKGYEDYTYSNYFIGRNEFEGFRSQQIMIRDGGFKVRTDLLAAKVGKTDDWLSALNLTTNIPNNINPLQLLPIKVPLRIFLDVGTYAEAWKKDAVTGRFIYDAGLQLSLLGNLLNIYVPVVYSKVYSDYFKSTITEKRFLKNISFSIDLQKFDHIKISNHLLY